MSTVNIGLLQAATAKMSHLDQRQRLIASNIANASTPNYKSRDLKPADFSMILKGATGSTEIHQKTTHSQHFPRQSDINSGRINVTSTFVGNGEISGVDLEDELLKSSEVALDYNMVTAIYERSVGLIRTAIGAGGR